MAASKRPEPLILALLLLIPALCGAAGTISFTADSVVSRFQKDNEATELAGNAQVVSGSLVIKADRIEIAGSSQRWVRANGNVTVRDLKRNLVIQGQNLSYDRQTERVRMQGSTSLEDFDNKVLIRSGVFEYHINDNLAIFHAGVKLYKDSMKASAEYATYQRDSSTLELNGLPRVTKGKDSYQASFIRVNTSTDEIQLLGSVSGTVRPSGGGD